MSGCLPPSSVASTSRAKFPSGRSSTRHCLSSLRSTEARVLFGRRPQRRPDVQFRLLFLLSHWADRSDAHICCQLTWFVRSLARRRDASLAPHRKVRDSAGKDLSGRRHQRPEDREFHCRHGAITVSFALREPQYQLTAACGHFGHEPFTKGGRKCFQVEICRDLSSTLFHLRPF